MLSWCMDEGRGEPAASGDEPELQAFVDDHYGRLVGLLRLRGTPTVDVEDVAQEAMVRLVENWPHVRTLDRPWRWLVHVALNVSRSRWRRWQTHLRRHHLLVGDGVHYDQAAIEALDLLQRLTERQRVAVVLRYYAGFSVQETAEAMGVAQGTVKSLCAKGLAAAGGRSDPAVAPLAGHDTEPVEAP